MVPQFQIEFRHPRVGDDFPALAIYLVDETSPLALPKEVYRSNNYGQTVVVEGKGIAFSEVAWGDATYCSAGGYDELETEVRKIFGSSAMSDWDEIDELVSGLVKGVKHQMQLFPGQYL